MIYVTESYNTVFLLVQVLDSFLLDRKINFLLVYDISFT